MVYQISKNLTVQKHQNYSWVCLVYIIKRKRTLVNHRESTSYLFRRVLIGHPCSPHLNPDSLTMTSIVYSSQKNPIPIPQVSSSSARSTSFSLLSPSLLPSLNTSAYYIYIYAGIYQISSWHHYFSATGLRKTIQCIITISNTLW